VYGQVRVYYLDHQYIIQEYCYTEGKGWFAGQIGETNTRTSTNSRIGAVQYGGVHVRVYYQRENYLSSNAIHLLKHREEAGSQAIKELCHDGLNWYEGALCLPGAFGGTSIAAVVCHLDGQLRVYYQTEDLSLREHCHDSKGWWPGQFVSTL